MAKYSKQSIPKISEEIIRNLVKGRHIEVTDKQEAIKDVESVLISYSNLEQDISRKAQEIIGTSGLSRDSFYKTKKSLAKEHGIEIGQETSEFLIKQIIATMMQSPYVDEVYSEDHILQRNMRTSIKELLNENKVVEQKIKKQLKHVDENTEKWKIEYQRLKEKIAFRNK